MFTHSYSNNNNDGKSKQPEKQYGGNGFFHPSFIAKVFQEWKKGGRNTKKRGRSRTCSIFSFFVVRWLLFICRWRVVCCLLFCNTSYFRRVVAALLQILSSENRLICSRKSKREKLFPSTWVAGEEIGVGWHKVGLEVEVFNKDFMLNMSFCLVFYFFTAINVPNQNLFLHSLKFHLRWSRSIFSFRDWIVIKLFSSFTRKEKAKKGIFNNILIYGSISSLE